MAVAAACRVGQHRRAAIPSLALYNGRAGHLYQHIACGAKRPPASRRPWPAGARGDRKRAHGAACAIDNGLASSLANIRERDRVDASIEEVNACGEAHLPELHARPVPMK